MASSIPLPLGTSVFARHVVAVPRAVVPGQMAAPSPATSEYLPPAVPSLDGVDGAFVHVPIMVNEMLAHLEVQAGHIVVDCTAGGGGHLRQLAQAVGPTGRVIAFDRDPRAHALDAAGGVAAAFADRVTLLHAPFADIRTCLDALGIAHVDGLFADLGVSSHQLDARARGFSFQADAPLDMRMDTTAGETAAELVARLSEEALANVLFEYGDEHKSRRIARFIKDRSPTTTAQLADAVIAAVGRQGKTHPATRTFQALRIAVNAELQQLETLLSLLPSVVKTGGRAAILSFHSLEDGRVKRCFRGDGYWALTKRPIEASDDEVAHNPRSRSAKLRAAIVGMSAPSRRDRYAQKASSAFEEDE